MSGIGKQSDAPHGARGANSVFILVCVCIYKHTLCVFHSKVGISLLDAHFLYFLLSFRYKFQGQEKTETRETIKLAPFVQHLDESLSLLCFKSALVQICVRCVHVT